MGAGKSFGIRNEYKELWEEAQGYLDKACADSFYGSDPRFREWFEVVAYWDFVNAAYDYDYKITEEDSEPSKAYKLSLMEEKNGPFEKLWGFVTCIAEISYSQGGRLRCEDDESHPQFFGYYFQYERKDNKWETDQDEQQFNEFVNMHPIDYIPLSIEHYREKGGIMWETDNVLLDMLVAVCC